MNHTNEFALLRTLCGIHAPSGNEAAMTSFILEYVRTQSKNWKCRPEVLHGDPFGEAVMLVYGSPRTAVFAHIDSVGFTVGYDNNLIRIGGPKATTGFRLRGHDSVGPVAGELQVDEETQEMTLACDRMVDRGTDLTFEVDFRENDDFIQCASMDNRLGVFNALRLAETMENGVLVFSCYEEHGGGSAAFLGGYLYERFGVRQALISDITWVTHGVLAGQGVAVSMRDSGIPRKSYLNRIRGILDSHRFAYQVEVESAGGSDGNELQKSPYPYDWCFIGAPEELVHSPNEKVHKGDARSMFEAYRILIGEL